MGDVSGHGIAAAILMSGMQALLRGLSSGPNCEIAGVVRELNRTVYDVSPDNFFATLFYARVDAAARQLIRSLHTTAPPRNREEEIRKARERSRRRFEKTG